MHHLFIMATSYDGLMLILQIPFSLVSAVVALILAFSKQSRFASVGFAVCAILFTLAGAALEVKSVGFQVFGYLNELGMLGVALTPMILALCVILFGAKQNSPPLK